MPYVAIALGALLLVAVLGWLLLADRTGDLDERPKLKQIARGARRTKGPIAVGAAVATAGLALWWFGREKRGGPAAAVGAEAEAAAASRERVAETLAEGEAERRDVVDNALAEVATIEAEVKADVSLIRATPSRSPGAVAAAWNAMDEGRD